MSGIRAKQRKLAAAAKAAAAAGAVCKPNIVVAKAGARSCTTCGAKAMTSKSMLVCARTGRLPGR